MRKWMLFWAAALLLSGCAAEPVYETIGDVCGNTEPVAAPGEITFAPPDGAARETSADGSGRNIYTVGAWEIWTQVYPGGDIRATMEQITGLGAQALTVMERQANGMACYETAWTTTGENGSLVGRAAVMDDGNYHYCLGLLVPEDQAEGIGEVFSQLLTTVTVTNTQT